MPASDLPPPTPTELAAIRARLNRRGSGDARTRLWLGIGSAVWMAAAAVAWLADRDDVARLVVGGALMLVLTAGLDVDRAATVVADARVMARMHDEPEGQGASATVAKECLREAVGRVVCLVTFGLAVVRFLAFVAPGPTDVSLAATMAAGSTAVFATVWFRTWRASHDQPTVGGTITLTTVDAAIRRSDFWRRNREVCMGLVLGPALAHQSSGDRPDLLGLAVLLGGVLLITLALTWRVSTDRLLLDEPRLGTARAPSAWLAGEPA